MMNTPTEHRRWEDETARERADQAPSYVEAKQMKSLRLRPHGCLRTLRTASANNLSGRMLFNLILSGMLILVLVLVLKNSLRTFSSPCPCPGPWGQVLVLVLVLGVRSLSLSWSLGVRSLLTSLLVERPYVAARAGFELTTLRTRAAESTNVPPRPSSFKMPASFCLL